MNEADYDVSFFDDTLDIIVDPHLRRLTRELLTEAPAWFWTAPASSTGKYHPPDSNGPGGTCRHTKKVVWFVLQFCRSHNIDSDALVAGAHLHDIRKFGEADMMETGSERPAYKNHGKLAVDAIMTKMSEVADTISDKLARYKFVAACNTMSEAVRRHMGRWGPEDPITCCDWMLHYADMAASEKHFVALSFYDPASLEHYDPGNSINPQHQDPTEGYLLKAGDGKWVINFGKTRRGRTIEDVVRNQPQYVEWVLDQDFPEAVVQVFKDEIARQETEANKPDAPGGTRPPQNRVEQWRPEDLLR